VSLGSGAFRARLSGLGVSGWTSHAGACDACNAKDAASKTPGRSRDEWGFAKFPPAAAQQASFKLAFAAGTPNIFRFKPIKRHPATLNAFAFTALQSAGNCGATVTT